MINHYSPCNNCGNKIKLEIYVQDDAKIDLNCPHCNETYKIKGLANHLSCKLVKQENQTIEKQRGNKMLKLKNALIKQGREYPDKIIYEILDSFRDEQIKAIVNGLDITDADRWIAMEKLVGTELKQAEALDIINKFWQYDIDTLDFEVGGK